SPFDGFGKPARTTRVASFIAGYSNPNWYAPIDIIRRMLQRLTSKPPASGVVAALALTLGGARLFSLLFPRVHCEPFRMHIHAYGIFILAVAVYLALLFHGARGRSWIALLYGLGLVLTFDEFGLWINPPFVRGVRWNTTGLTITLVACAVGTLIPVLLRRRYRG